MKKKSPSGICPLPWIHMSARLDTAMRVCCNTDHGGFVRRENGDAVFIEELSDPADYFNAATLKNLRRQMMEGERPDFCNACYRIEDTGGTSIRQTYEKQFAQTMTEELPRTSPDGHLSAPRIRYLDLPFGNKCNLMCRMCNPYPSYSLKKDFDEEGLSYIRENADWANSRWKSDPAFDSLMEKTLPTVTEILTTGGEPFISAQHRHVLRAAIDLGSANGTILRYHTNLAVIPEELVSLWKSFRRIDVHVSIEAYGALNEYIRHPLPWDRLEKNLERLVQLSSSLPISIEIHTCFQAYNLFGLPEFLDYLRRYEGKMPILPYPILLTEPKYLQATALPLKLRAEGAEKLRRFLDQHRESYLSGHFRDFHAVALSNFDCYLNNLEAAPYDPQLFAEFTRYTEIFDRRRDQSVGSLIPQLKTPS